MSDLDLALVREVARALGCADLAEDEGTRDRLAGMLSAVRDIVSSARNTDRASAGETRADCLVAVLVAVALFATDLDARARARGFAVCDGETGPWVEPVGVAWLRSLVAWLGSLDAESVADRFDRFLADRLKPQRGAR